MPDVAPSAYVAHADPLQTWLQSSQPIAPEVVPAKTASARVNADRAILEFQSVIFDLTYEQTKEAYIRLLAGRGFTNKAPTSPGPIPPAPTA